MKVILSVPDEGYSRNASCVVNLISPFLLLFYDNDEHHVIKLIKSEIKLLFSFSAMYAEPEIVN